MKLATIQLISEPSRALVGTENKWFVQILGPFLQPL